MPPPRRRRLLPTATTSSRCRHPLPATAAPRRAAPRPPRRRRHHHHHSPLLRRSVRAISAGAMAGGGGGRPSGRAPRGAAAATTIQHTIQSIKEVVVGHSNDDIYAALRESNMDPNETAQKLLNQGAASDDKCDEPDEEEVTVILEEGNSKLEETEQDVDVNSYAGLIESVVHLDLSSHGPKKEEGLVVVVEEAPKQPEIL